MERYLCYVRLQNYPLDNPPLPAETPLHELSGSALRKLAISEVEQFILLLDKGTSEELQAKKTSVTAIFAQLSEKEKAELEALVGDRLMVRCVIAPPA